MCYVAISWCWVNIMIVYICEGLLHCHRCHVVIIYAREIANDSLIAYVCYLVLFGPSATSSSCHTRKVLLFICFKSVWTYKGYHELGTYPSYYILHRFNKYVCVRSRVCRMVVTSRHQYFGPWTQVIRRVMRWLKYQWGWWVLGDFQSV